MAANPTGDISGRRIQILHTNDLHSMLAGVGDSGGYARIKTVIDELREEAEEQAIETLILDAGDFSEGSSFYLIDRGVDTFRALDLLECDAAVLGNHDHLMGEKILAEQVSEAGLKAHLLSANLISSPDSPLHGLVHPGKTFNRGGLKIMVIGLSTPEIYYQYPFESSCIIPAAAVCEKYAERARRKGADLVIALTHLGIEADRRLIASTRSIDLVIGGHSHTRLEKPSAAKNRESREVPIVQTGAHGQAVGRLLIEIRQSGDIEIADYSLYNIDPSVSRNPEVASFLEKASKRRNIFFDRRWNEKVGKSRVKLTGYYGKAQKISSWEKHQARMVQQAADTEIGLHIGNFNGLTVSSGEITYGDIVDNMPRVRSFGEQGWRIGRSKIRGWHLMGILKVLVNYREELDFAFYGLEWRHIKLPRFLPLIGNRYIVWLVKINGQLFNPNRSYSLAFPAEIAYVLRELLPPAKQTLFPDFEETGLFYWSQMETYIRENSPLKEL